MSDNEPQPSKNPFIRFKQHVDSHISTGIGLVTGSSASPKQDNDSFNMDDETTPPPPPPPPFPTETSSLLDWTAWATHSPYSPHNLTYLRRQPIPNDLPAAAPTNTTTGSPAAAAAAFTFHDAFEDLLAQSARLPPLDLHRQLGLNHQLRTLLPPLDDDDVTPTTTRHTRVVPWILRLHGRGLLGSSAAAPTSPPPPARGLPEILEHRGRGILAEMDKLMEEAWGPVERLMGEAMFGPSAERIKAKHEQQQQQHKDDDDDDDDDQRSPEYKLVLRQLQAENCRRLQQQRRQQHEREEMTRLNDEIKVEQVSENGGRTIQTKSEYVDVFGNVHCRTETKHLDAQGFAVSCESHYHMRPSSKAQEPKDTTARNDDDENRSTGWFWR